MEDSEIQPNIIENTTQKKHSKTPLIIVLAIILIVGVAGGTYYWQHQQVINLNNQKNSLSKQLTSLKGQITNLDTSINKLKTASTDVTTLKLPLLGIEVVNIPASLSDLVVTETPFTGGGDGAYFSTKTLTALDSECSTTNVGIGSIGEEPGTYNSQPIMSGQFVKQLTSSWISYAHPQAECSTDPTTEALHEYQNAVFDTLITNPANLQPIK